MWNLLSVLLYKVLVSVHVESFWMHLMELLDDVGHVESPFGPFGDSVSFSAS
jgi:hypothetical protein